MGVRSPHHRIPMHGSYTTQCSFITDVAYHAYSRCISASDDKPIDHEDFQVELTYEFVDDVYGDWVSDDVFMDTEEGRATGEKLTQNRLQRLMENKETHTYSHMVKMLCNLLRNEIIFSKSFFYKYS